MIARERSWITQQSSLCNFAPRQTGEQGSTVAEGSQAGRVSCVIAAAAAVVVAAVAFVLSLC